MVRLGIWGPGSPFRDFNDFLAAVEKRGVGAMEIVAMDMKLRGMYIARQLSFQVTISLLPPSPQNLLFLVPHQELLFFFFSSFAWRVWIRSAIWRFVESTVPGFFYEPNILIKLRCLFLIRISRLASDSRNISISSEQEMSFPPFFYPKKILLSSGKYDFFPSRIWIRKTAVLFPSLPSLLGNISSFFPIC
jgi:hypothetical protein